MMGLCRGGINSGMGLFFQPISADMHIGVGEVAMMSSISALITMFWSPFAGRLLDKFDIRIITVVAVAIQAGCFAALSLVDAVWGFYALAASAEITPIITEVLANVTRDEAIEKLMTTDIPFDLCQHFADLQDDQQAWDAGCFQGIDYPSGKHIGIVKAPAIFSSGEAEFGPSGYPGEYTREVLKEYGFDDAKIDELREQGLVTEEDQWDKDQYNMEKLMAQAAAAKKKAE